MDLPSIPLNVMVASTTTGSRTVANSAQTIRETSVSQITIEQLQSHINISNQQLESGGSLTEYEQQILTLLSSVKSTTSITQESLTDMLNDLSSIAERHQLHRLQYELGVIYLEGKLGLPKQLSVARGLLEQASFSKQIEKKAYLKLCELFTDTDYEKYDPARSVQYLETVCAAHYVKPDLVCEIYLKIGQAYLHLAQKTKTALKQTLLLFETSLKYLQMAQESASVKQQALEIGNEIILRRGIATLNDKSSSEENYALACFTMLSVINLLHQTLHIPELTPSKKLAEVSKKACFELATSMLMRIQPDDASYKQSCKSALSLFEMGLNFFPEHYDGPEKGWGEVAPQIQNATKCSGLTEMAKAGNPFASYVTSMRYADLHYCLAGRYPRELHAAFCFESKRLPDLITRQFEPYLYVAYDSYDYPKSGPPSQDEVNNLDKIMKEAGSNSIDFYLLSLEQKFPTAWQRLPLVIQSCDSNQDERVCPLTERLQGAAKKYLSGCNKSQIEQALNVFDAAFQDNDAATLAFINALETHPEVAEHITAFKANRSSSVESGCTVQ